MGKESSKLNSKNDRRLNWIESMMGEEKTWEAAPNYRRLPFSLQIPVKIPFHPFKTAQQSSSIHTIPFHTQKKSKFH